MIDDEDYDDLLRELNTAKAKLAEWQAAQHYTYIGKDGKPVLARDLEARADAAEAKLAKVEEDRDDALIALASARKQLERYIAEAEAALPAVYRLALADASKIVSNAGHSLHVEIDYLPTPTAAELMARIQTGEKE